ncbi:MAG: acylglycerol kinase family protein [Nitrosomonas sp.]|nr:acylglycerol kinase family protein [Nitrosomonas sp.]MDP1949706.1 acylglycerol kinase family protein [Nitrosomonas sp.]
MAEQLKIDRLETGAPRIGLLFNPLGGQARKRELAIRQILTEIPRVIIHEATNAREFKTSIDCLLQADIDLLVIIGGDGTIHATLSHLFATLPPAKWPVLALVPGGTTNMTSLDLGVRGKPEQVLQRLCNYLLKPSESVLVQRAVLRVEQTGSEKIHGMFFAVGLVARGVKFSRSSVKQLGITGSIFTILIMLRSLAGMILGRHQTEWAPAELSITEANGETHKGTYLFALVSVLDRLLLGIRPYWGKAQAPLHVTTVDQQCKHLWRSLWALFSGQGHRLKEQDGYHSCNIHTLELLMDDEYIVDGELYQATSLNGPLRISATEPVTFLVL